MLNLSCSISSSFASKSLCTICLSCSAAISKRSLALKNNLKNDERTVSFFLDVYWETAKIPPPHPRKYYLFCGRGGREDPIKIYKPRLSDSFFPAIIHCIRRGFQIYFALSSLLPSHLLTVFRQKLELSVPPEVSCTPKFPTSNFSINFQNNRERTNFPGIL